MRLRPGTRSLHEYVESFVSVMNADQLCLGMKLLNVTHSMDGFPYDVSALNELYFAAQHSVLAPLFEPDASVAPFITGLYLWSDGLVEALRILGSELRALEPDWTALRQRIAGSSQFYFNGLVPQIRSELEALRADGTTLEVEEMSSALEELFFAARLLDLSLQNRFG